MGASEADNSHWRKGATTRALNSLRRRCSIRLLALLSVPLLLVMLVVFRGPFASRAPQDTVSQQLKGAVELLAAPAKLIFGTPADTLEELFAAPVKVDRPASVAFGGDDHYHVFLEKCGYAPQALDVFLAKDHGTARESKRYLYEGEWYTHSELHDFVWGRGAVIDNIMCLLLHLKNEAPCLNRTCLLETFIRKKTSDLKVVHMLFEKGEFDYLKDYQPRTILDAGANIGLASKIFATMWPNARIIALEPSTRNFDVLERNVRNFPNVTPVHVGLWGKPTRLLLKLPEDDNVDNEWGFQAHEVEEVDSNDEEMTLYGLNVELLMDMFQVKAFDYLKIDIEGSEEQVFTSSKVNSMKWVKSAILMSVEIHTTRAEKLIYQLMDNLPEYKREPQTDSQFWRNAKREAEIM